MIDDFTSNQQLLDESGKKSRSWMVAILDRAKSSWRGAYETFSVTFGSWIKENWKWVIGFGFLIIATFILLPYFWRESSEDKSVVAQWNDTISRLGIDPVFPPEEDLYVGDMLAVIIADNRPGGAPLAQPLLNRAIKLAHVDLAKDLTDYYQTVPIFPDTAKRPELAQEPWIQNMNPKGLFGSHDARGVLGIAAFPGFTIRHERAASGGLSTFGFGLFGSSRRDNDLVEVRIPFAETYGIPSALAVGKLAQFCVDPFTKDICRDQTLRNHLSYVARGVLDKTTDPVTGRPRYLVDVEIALVNRVYLTRSIEQTVRLGRNGAAILQAASEASSRLKPGLGASGQKPEPQTGVSETSTATQQKQTQDILDRLDAAVPGGLVSVIASSDSQYELKQTFQRPIVIGYRAVRRSFDDELDPPNSTPGRQGGKK